MSQQRVSCGAKKSFPPSFYLSSFHFYIIEKATQQGTLGGCTRHRPVGVDRERADEMIKLSHRVPVEKNLGI